MNLCINATCILPDEEDGSRRLFADDIEEGTVGVEYGVVRHTRRSFYNSDCSCFCPLLVKFDYSHLTHIADIDWHIAETRELCIDRKGGWHAKGRHHIHQLYLTVRLKARQLQIHIMHIASTVPVATIESIEHVADCLAFTRQEDTHIIGTVAVWQIDGLIEIVLLID